MRKILEDQKHRLERKIRSMQEVSNNRSLPLLTPNQLPSLPLHLSSNGILEHSHVSTHHSPPTLSTLTSRNVATMASGGGGGGSGEQQQLGSASSMPMPDVGGHAVGGGAPHHHQASLHGPGMMAGAPIPGLGLAGLSRGHPMDQEERPGFGRGSQDGQTRGYHEQASLASVSAGIITAQHAGPYLHILRHHQNAHAHQAALYAAVEQTPGVVGLMTATAPTTVGAAFVHLPPLLQSSQLQLSVSTPSVAQNLLMSTAQQQQQPPATTAEHASLPGVATTGIQCVVAGLSNGNSEGLVSTEVRPGVIGQDSVAAATAAATQAPGEASATGEAVPLAMPAVAAPSVAGTITKPVDCAVRSSGVDQFGSGLGEHVDMCSRGTPAALTCRPEGSAATASPGVASVATVGSAVETMSVTNASGGDRCGLPLGGVLAVADSVEHARVDEASTLSQHKEGKLSSGAVAGVAAEKTSAVLPDIASEEMSSAGGGDSLVLPSEQAIERSKEEHEEPAAVKVQTRVELDVPCVAPIGVMSEGVTSATTTVTATILPADIAVTRHRSRRSSSARHDGIVERGQASGVDSSEINNESHTNPDVVAVSAASGSRGDRMVTRSEALLPRQTRHRWPSEGAKDAPVESRIAGRPLPPLPLSGDASTTAADNAEAAMNRIILSVSPQAAEMNNVSSAEDRSEAQPVPPPPPSPPPAAAANDKIGQLKIGGNEQSMTPEAVNTSSIGTRDVMEGELAVVVVGGMTGQQATSAHQARAVTPEDQITSTKDTTEVEVVSNVAATSVNENANATHGRGGRPNTLPAHGVPRGEDGRGGGVEVPAVTLDRVDDQVRMRKMAAEAMLTFR